MVAAGPGVPDQHARFRLLPVRLEASRAGAEEYPHVYGALPVDAVTGVIAVSRDAAGRLVLPG